MWKNNWGKRERERERDSEKKRERERESKRGEVERLKQKLRFVKVDMRQEIHRVIKRGMK